MSRIGDVHFDHRGVRRFGWTVDLTDLELAVLAALFRNAESQSSLTAAEMSATGDAVLRNARTSEIEQSARSLSKKLGGTLRGVDRILVGQKGEVDAFRIIAAREPLSFERLAKHLKVYQRRVMQPRLEGQLLLDDLRAVVKATPGLSEIIEREQLFGAPLFPGPGRNAREAAKLLRGIRSYQVEKEALTQAKQIATARRQRAERRAEGRESKAQLTAGDVNDSLPKEEGSADRGQAGPDPEPPAAAGAHPPGSLPPGSSPPQHRSPSRPGAGGRTPAVRETEVARRGGQPPPHARPKGPDQVAPSSRAPHQTAALDAPQPSLPEDKAQQVPEKPVEQPTVRALPPARPEIAPDPVIVADEQSPSALAPQQGDPSNSPTADQAEAARREPTRLRADDVISPPPPPPPPPPRPSAPAPRPASAESRTGAGRIGGSGAKRRTAASPPPDKAITGGEPGANGSDAQNETPISKPAATVHQGRLEKAVGDALSADARVPPEDSTQESRISGRVKEQPPGRVVAGRPSARPPPGTSSSGAGSALLR